jgi:hypothetical protein
MDYLCKRYKELAWKLKLIFNGLHGVISHKIELFITTASRISNFASMCTNIPLPIFFSWGEIPKLQEFLRRNINLLSFHMAKVIQAGKLPAFRN